MEMTSEKINGSTILQLAGRFDAYAAPDVEIFFLQMDTASVPYVIVNLTNVNFIDSTDLAALVIGMKRCRQRQGALVLCGIQQAVRIIFEITCLDKIFPTTRTQAEAIAKLQMLQKS